MQIELHQTRRVSSVLNLCCCKFITFKTTVYEIYTQSFKVKANKLEILVSNEKGMKQRIKSIVFYLPKLIVFGLALLNFLYILSHIPIRTGTKITFCMVCPWYETSDFKDVLIILAASVFLLIGNRVSYLIAGSLSGYIVAIALFHLIFRNMSLLERWEGIQKYETNIFLAFEIQWILAGIVFSFTAFYFLQDVLRKKYS